MQVKIQDLETSVLSKKWHLAAEASQGTWNPDTTYSFNLMSPGFHF